MKTINDDTYQFFAEGGWDFLAEGSDVSIIGRLPMLCFDILFNLSFQADDGGESESGSEFEVSGSDVHSESSNESSYDEDASADEGSDSEEEDSGEDWDELELKAKRSDERKHGEDISDDDARRKLKKPRR